MKKMQYFLKLSIFFFISLILVSCGTINKIPDKISYNITFNTNQGSAITAIDGYADTSISQPTNPTRLGFDFSGWYYDQQLTQLVTWPITLTQNLNLYAKWTENTQQVIIYNVVFNTMGGSSINLAAVEAGTILSKPSNPVKSGSTFLNWYLDEQYTQLATFPFSVTNNITFYAKWEIVVSNDVKLSYYQLSTINISKVINTKMINGFSDTYAFISSEGKIYQSSKIYNQLTNQMDQIFYEMPFSMDGEIADEKIVDAIIYEPVVLLKMESGKWFGIEFGEYATGDYLGKANEIVSIDRMLNLDLDESIVQINTVERFFYAFTSKGKVFLAGTLEINGNILTTFEQPLNITQEFQLGVDEYFIPNDEQLAAIGFEQLALRTNKRIFIPRVFAALATNKNDLGNPNHHFIDINLIDEHTYSDVLFSKSGSSLYLQLLSSELLNVHSYYHGDHELDSYSFDLNPDETIRFIITIPMTNQNRYFSSDGFHEFVVGGKIVDFLVGYETLVGEFNYYLDIFFKTDTNHYYYLGNEIDDLTDITDIVSNYSFNNGFWQKDGKSYVYNAEQNKMVLNNYESLTIQSEMVEKNSIINVPIIEDERYNIDGWYNLPTQNLITEDWLLIPVIENPSMRYIDININIAGSNQMSIGIALPQNHSFTKEEIMKFVANSISSSHSIQLDMDYLDIQDMRVNQQLMDSVLITSGVNTINFNLQIKNDSTLVTLYYMTPYNQINYQMIFAHTGDEIDFNRLSSLFDFPVLAWYDSEDFTTLFTGSVYTENLTLYASLDYPISSITLVLSHDLGQRTVEYVTGFMPDMIPFYQEFTNDSPYRIIGFYQDQAYTEKINPYNLSYYDLIYVKLGRIFKVDFYGTGIDHLFYNDLIVIEGYFFEDIINQINYEHRQVVGFYYDSELTQPIDTNLEIPFGIETIYVKFVELEYKLVQLIIVGYEHPTIEFKFYEGAYRLDRLLASQHIFIDYIPFYSDASLENRIGYFYSHIDYENVPNIIYIDGSQVQFYLFSNETYQLDIIVINNSSHAHYQLSDIIFDVFDFDSYIIFDHDGQIVYSLSDQVAEGFNSYEITLTRLPRVTVSFYIADVLYEIENMRLNASNNKDFHKLDNKVMEILFRMNFDYDEFIYYVDENFEIEWNRIVTENLVLYVKPVVYERTDVTVHLGDTIKILFDVVIGKYGYNVEHSIYMWFYYGNFEGDEFKIYTDSFYENEWDFIVTEDLVLYVKIIFYPRTDVKVYINDQYLIVTDVLIDFYNSEVYYAVFEFLIQNGISFDGFEIFFDPSFTLHYYSRILKENEELYVKLTTYPRTQVTLHINDEIIIEEQYLIGYDNVYSIIFDYLHDMDMIDSVDFIVYLDSAYTLPWNRIDYENMTLYIELFDTSATSMVTVIYDDEMISNDMYNHGMVNIYLINQKVLMYLYDNHIEFNEFEFYTDQEMTMLWDEYIRGEMVLYVDIIIYEMTKVTIDIDSYGSIEVDVLTGYQYSYDVNLAINHYLSQQNITYDHYQIYNESTFETDWNGYITKNLEIYVKLIIYPRTTAYIIIDGITIEYNDLMLNGHNISRVYQLISNYAFENSIYFDDYEIYTNSDMTTVWNRTVVANMSLYVVFIKLTLEERLKYDFGDDVIYYEVSDEINDFFSQIINHETLIPRLYIILPENDNYFLYVIYMTDGIYYNLYTTWYFYSDDISIDEVINRFDVEPTTSIELTTIDQINEQSLILYNYPNGFDSWEDFINEMILSEHFVVYVYYNEWMIDGFLEISVDVIIEFNGFYMLWHSFY